MTVLYSESKALAEVEKRLRAWRRGNPGPVSGPSPTKTYEKAIERFTADTGVEIEYGHFVDALFSYGIAADQVGDNWWLRIAGKNRDHLQVVDTPTRING